MKTTTKELFMKITQEEINSVNLRAGRFDMTQIPRLRTDFTEDLWIELDCQLIDAIEAEKERKAKRKVNYLKREVIELCRKGYMASEIHSITRASLVDIAKWTKKITLEDTLLEDCPEDIRNDLLAEFE